MGSAAQHGEATSAEKLASLLLYASCSMVISMMYKGVLSSFDFKAPFTLLAGQTFVALLFTSFAQRFLSSSKAFYVPPFSMRVLKSALLPGTLFVSNIAVGFLGLRLVNVPMFLAVRRTTTIFTMAAEWAILGNQPSGLAMLSVALIGAGAIIAGMQTFATEVLGFVFTLFNNAITAVQLNIAKRFSDEHNVKGFGMVYYNSLVALPLSLLCMVVFGEVQYLAAYERYSISLAIAVVAASSLGVIMTFAVFWCTTTNSPVVTSVTGNVKDVISTFVGAALFPGFVATAYTVGGLATSFTGSALYTYAKLSGKSGSTATSKAASHSPSTQQERDTLLGGNVDQDARLKVGGEPGQQDV